MHSAVKLYQIIINSIVYINQTHHDKSYNVSLSHICTTIIMIEIIVNGNTCSTVLVTKISQTNLMSNIVLQL